MIPLPPYLLTKIEKMADEHQKGELYACHYRHFQCCYSSSDTEETFLEGATALYNLILDMGKEQGNQPKCELCGSPVQVVGKTTQHYEPMSELSDEFDEKQVDEASLDYEERIINGNYISIGPGLNEGIIADAYFRGARDQHAKLEFVFKAKHESIKSEAISTIERRMRSDDGCGHPFDEDLGALLEKLKGGG